MKSAYEDADKHNWTKEELDAYDYALMREQDDRGRISFALRTGITKVQKDIAKKFLLSGSSVEIVAENTGLTVEQVISLQGDN